MIDPSQLKDTHKGSKVVYLNRTQDGTLLVREWGHISGWNSQNIWVRFPDAQIGKLCSPRSLLFYEDYELFGLAESEEAEMRDTWGMTFDRFKEMWSGRN